MTEKKTTTTAQKQPDGIITTQRNGQTNVFPFVIANTIFFGDWGTGREKYKKLQQAEMDKMKARDIN